MMTILIQLYNLLYFLFCFAFIDMIKVKYIFLLTHLYYYFRQITEYKNRSVSLESLLYDIE